MSASVRDREAAAIAVLVALCGPDGPDEWQPHDHDAGEAAAVVAAEWVKRDGRAKAAAEPAPAPTRAPRPKQKRKPAELVRSEAIVKDRSGGNCEARTPWCEGRAREVHHMAGRTDHRPEMLLHVCGHGNVDGCHGYISQHPTESYANGWMVKRNGAFSGQGM